MQDSAELNPDDFPEGEEQTLDVMPSSPSDVSNQELNPDDFPEA
ncbi:MULTISPECIES: hypothetical protein [Aerosakkonema]